jgi:hypothetical protein
MPKRLKLRGGFRENRNDFLSRTKQMKALEKKAKKVVKRKKSKK